MYQELSSNRRIDFLQVGIKSLLAFAGLFAFNILMVSFYSNNAFIDICTIITFVILVYLFTGGKGDCFKYMVIGNEFIIQHVTRAKEKVVLNIAISQIEVFNSTKANCYDSDKKQIFSTKRKYYNRSRKAELYYCIYICDEEKHFIEFQPTKKLIQILDKKTQNTIK